MKNLIITMAIALLIGNLLIFQYDSYRLVFAMNSLKNLSDEMTRSAALFISEEDFAKGVISFEKDQGKEKAKEIFNKQLKNIKTRMKGFPFDENNITYSISFDNKSAKVKTTIKCGIPKYTLKYLQSGKSLNCSSTYEYKL